jgi:hypothetical protein
MKHLRKYNESESQLDDLLSWVRVCFSDFYDRDEVEEDFDFWQTVTIRLEDRFAIMIDIPITTTEKKEIDDFINWSTELNEFFLDIQVAINRVKDKYPNIVVKLKEDNKSVNMKFIIYFIK